MYYIKNKRVLTKNSLGLVRNTMNALKTERHIMPEVFMARAGNPGEGILFFQFFIIKIYINILANEI